MSDPQNDDYSLAQPSPLKYVPSITTNSSMPLAMSDTKIPIDPSPTPQDYSTWGFYCDSCKVFFDIQIDGAAHSSVDGISYSHKCGSGARYISYDRRSVSETKIPDDLKNLNDRVHDLSVGYSGREDVKRLIKLISSERAAVKACEKELREENQQLSEGMDFLRKTICALEQTNASLRAKLAETQAGLQSVQDQRNSLDGRVQDLEHRLAEATKPVTATVEHTCTGPHLFIGDILVRSWFGTSYNDEADKLATDLNRAAKGGE